MIQLLPQSEILDTYSTNPIEAVEHISSYIEKYHCENLTVDISHLNIMDSCMVSTLCSAKHYIKYPQGKINWKVSSEVIKDFNKDFDLGNSDYIL